MSKKTDRPLTRSKAPEPQLEGTDWIIWAAWADRITFEEIEERTGISESQVIRMMRKELKPSSFRLWRQRVRHQSIKHRRLFQQRRRLYKKHNWKQRIQNFFDE